MIDAVHRYYNTEVDIVAYSMGSPLARKSILGGKCVDADIDMGGALTDFVHTFVSVAGANRGSYICEIPLIGACNLINGLHCHSKFIDDINNQYYYEGAKVYNIYSDTDPIIGLYTCGYQSTAISGAQDIKLSGLTHKGTMFDTFQRQVRLLMQENQVTLAEERREVAALKLADKELTDAKVGFQRDQAQFNNENRRYVKAYRRWLSGLASVGNRERYGDFKHALQRVSAQNRQLNRRLRSVQKNNNGGRKRETNVQRFARLIREGNKQTGKLGRELKRLQQLNTQSQRRINKIKRANEIAKRLELAMRRRLQRQQKLQRSYKRFHTYPANLSKSIHFETTTEKPDDDSLIISKHAGETPEDPALKKEQKEKEPQIITSKILPQKIKELVSQLATEVEKESQTTNTTEVVKSKFVPDMQSLNTDN
ncbi:hypothetical protein WR25_06612 [Diploscapter pachys]|uniref:Lipase domain-containing protein n=1 Tax=Diploscapter pachys TaxID=2018661 RepID=A0A2A2L160_9BILA|nr:hypothetical protein WR25_06612 [Diploscapter pachys]